MKKTDSSSKKILKECTGKRKKIAADGEWQYEREPFKRYTVWGVEIILVVTKEGKHKGIPKKDKHAGPGSSQGIWDNHRGKGWFRCPIVFVQRGLIAYAKKTKVPEP